MKKTLIKSLSADEGKLYIVRDGNRDFEIINNIEINLYEEKEYINRLGSKNTTVITNNISLVLTEPLDNIAKVDDCFSLEVDLKRNDGIYERVYFNNLIPLNIYPNERWEFEVDYKSINWGKFMG
ncbi:hypothetical protein [Peptoniphilus catoniae]|uniref:hypothetical protein n=1 Tax=Peptoniphilus catoniae TaxID=1660341 RepID=UPI0010FDD7FD|nr:hypothetical protein [Peptoniphilus catoniae]